MNGKVPQFSTQSLARQSQGPLPIIPQPHIRAYLAGTPLAHPPSQSLPFRDMRPLFPEPRACRHRLTAAKLFGLFLHGAMVLSKRCRRLRKPAPSLHSASHRRENSSRSPS